PLCFQAPAPSDIYTLSLHDALPILITIIPPSPPQPPELPPFGGTRRGVGPSGGLGRPVPNAGAPDTTRPIPAPVGRPDSTLAARSEEHTSELQSRFDLVCRLLLEKK